MGRVELQRSIHKIEDLQKLVNQAKNDGADAICVPPFFVSTAAEMLGRNRISIVTTAGRDEDMMETKMMGIQQAAKAGANEVIISLPHQNLNDEKWDVIEKEIYKLCTVASASRVMCWIGCRFAHLKRPVQAKLCEMIPKGMNGLRVRGTSVEDIQLAKLCGVEAFCACFAYSEHLKPTPSVLEMFEGAGATQFTLLDVPERKRTTDVAHTEVSI